MFSGQLGEGTPTDRLLGGHAGRGEGVQSGEILLTPLDWLSIGVGVIAIIGSVAKAKRRKAGLCEKCGRRPATTTRLDAFERMSVCDSCSAAWFPSWTRISEGVFTCLAAAIGVWISMRLCGSSQTCSAVLPWQALTACVGLGAGAMIGWRLRNVSF